MGGGRNAVAGAARGPKKQNTPNSPPPQKKGERISDREDYKRPLSRAQIFAFDPGLGFVERPVEAVEEFGDLVFLDNQRRAEGHGVSEVAGDEAVRLGSRRQVAADGAGGLEGALGALVGDQFHRAQQADAARVAT